MKNYEISEKECSFVKKLLKEYCVVKEWSKEVLMNELMSISDMIVDDDCIDFEKFDLIVESLDDEKNVNKLLMIINR